MSQQIAKMLVYMLNVSNILTIKLCPTAAQTLRAAISLSSQSQTHVHTPTDAAKTIPGEQVKYL